MANYKNLHGKKGRSGRRPLAEEIRRVLNTNLAREIVNEELARIRDSDVRKITELQTIVMPIVLKDMTEKKEMHLEGLPQPIVNLVNVLPNNSNQQNPRIIEEDTSNIRGNISIEDNQYTPLLDCESTVR
jgi:hypothetical protein